MAPKPERCISSPISVLLTEGVPRLSFGCFDRLDNLFPTRPAERPLHRWLFSPIAGQPLDPSPREFFAAQHHARHQPFPRIVGQPFPHSLLCIAADGLLLFRFAASSR